MQERNEELLELLERRAREQAGGLTREQRVDLVEALRPKPEGEDEAAPDVFLGGYIEEHERPPAFEGKDGQPYTVDIDVEETGDPERPLAGFLVFLRWARTGGGIMQHLTSEDIAYGANEEEARARALGLSLYEVKAELDAAIERRRSLLED